MHEMSVVRDIVDMVLQACAEQGEVSSVRRIHLTIGCLHDVVDEYVPGLFRYLAKGTIAENAQVEITDVPVTVRCAACSDIFPADVYSRLRPVCPHCGRADRLSLFSGREFRLDSIEVEFAEPAEDDVALAG